MSHVVEIDVQIKDLDALAAAAKRLGLQLVLGQKTYRWYGRWVGDHPLPKGITQEELGKCEHALTQPGNQAGYEVGVVKRKDGKGYTLLWDFWSGGYGLQAKIGDGAQKLRQRYAAEVSIKNARRQGFSVKETVGQDGRIRLVCQK